MKEKPINTYEELRDFSLAVVNAIGEISIEEAKVAIDKAFTDFKSNFSNTVSKLELDE